MTRPVGVLRVLLAVCAVCAVLSACPALAALDPSPELERGPGPEDEGGEAAGPNPAELAEMDAALAKEMEQKMASQQQQGQLAGSVGGTFERLKRAMKPQMMALVAPPSVPVRPHSGRQAETLADLLATGNAAQDKSEQIDLAAAEKIEEQFSSGDGPAQPHPWALPLPPPLQREARAKALDENMLDKAQAQLHDDWLPRPVGLPPASLGPAAPNAWTPVPPPNMLPQGVYDGMPGGYNGVGQQYTPASNPPDIPWAHPSLPVLADTGSKCMACVHVIQSIRSIPGAVPTSSISLAFEANPCINAPVRIAPWCYDVHKKLLGCQWFYRVFDRDLTPVRICEDCTYLQAPLPDQPFCANSIYMAQPNYMPISIEGYNSAE